MRTIVEIGGARFGVLTDRPFDLAIPVRFGPAQVRAFGLGPARAEVARVGPFVGSVAMGGSCNCLTVTFNPHANGTHTEAIGHLLAEPVPIGDVLAEPWLAASVVSVLPSGGVVTRASLDQALAATDPDWREAVVLRTQRDGAALHDRDWSASEPPCLAPAAAARLAEVTRHVLIDLPSLDPQWDQGALLAHRAFFGEPADRRTVTELIAVPDAVLDGRYVLSLQIAPVALDAAPSRPLLFAIEPLA